MRWESEFRKVFSLPFRDELHVSLGICCIILFGILVYEAKIFSEPLELNPFTIESQ